MKLLDENFRNIDRKWIAIEKYKDIKKINKALKLELDDALTLAYVYIDSEKGISFRILGNIFHEDDSLHVSDNYLTNDYVLNGDLIKKISFQLVNDETKKVIDNLDIIEKDIDSKYYNKASILEARGLAILDQFRHELFPDDLELYFESNKKSELIWGRTQVYSSDKNILACKLLSDSNINKDYKKDAFVFVKIVKDKKDIDIVIDKLADVKSH